MGWIADLLKEIPSAARYKSELDGMLRENSDLKSEVSALRTQVDNLESAIRELRHEIQQRDDVAQNEKTHSTLPKEQDQILRFLADNNASDERRIASHIKLSVPDTIHYLNDLRSNGYVTGEQQRPPLDAYARKHAMPSNWSLQPKAYTYLHECKLA